MELLEGLYASYWAWAFGIAAAFYSTMSWIGRHHINQDAKDTLTLWLMGVNADSWSHHFCNLFDAIFGEKHLSWRCFVRSSIASVLAVLALYLLFAQVLGVLDERMLGELDLWQAILLGAAINIIPDYISLFETRWLLKQFERVTSFPAQLLVLLGDLVLSGAIIWLGVTVFHVARGAAPPGPVEMLALFSIFSVFFYSTFLTSVWAWLYCASSWFMRLFVQTPLGRILPIERTPLRQVGLVGGAIVFAVCLILGPVSKASESGMVSAFDEMLCDMLGGRLCLHLARRQVDGDDGYAKLSQFCAEANPWECYARVLEFFEGDAAQTSALWERGCEAGYGESCHYLADIRQFVEGSEDAMRSAVDLYGKSCALDVARSCTARGLVLADGHGYASLADAEAAAMAYNKACALGDAEGCTMLGEAHHEGRGVLWDGEVALGFLIEGCSGGHAPGCTVKGDVLVSLGRPQDAAEAYWQGCDNRDAPGCTALGDLLERGDAAPPRPEVTGFEAYREGCTLRSDTACQKYWTLAGMRQPSDMDTEEFLQRVRSIAWNEKRCSDGVALDCSMLGASYASGKIIPQDLDRARELMGKGCSGGVGWACVRLFMEEPVGTVPRTTAP